MEKQKQATHLRHSDEICWFQQGFGASTFCPTMLILLQVHPFLRSYAPVWKLAGRSNSPLRTRDEQRWKSMIYIPTSCTVHVFKVYLLNTFWRWSLLLLMAKILHQLMSAVYPIISQCFCTIPGGWPWDFWTINLYDSHMVHDSGPKLYYFTNLHWNPPEILRPKISRNPKRYLFGGAWSPPTQLAVGSFQAPLTLITHKNPNVSSCFKQKTSTYYKKSMIYGIINNAHYLLINQTTPEHEYETWTFYSIL